MKLDLIMTSSHSFSRKTNMLRLRLKLQQEPQKEFPLTTLSCRVSSSEELLYKYKGEVEIPSLGMVDDTIRECSEDSVRINTVVNAFVEAKKLILSSKKCHKMHIQKKSNQQRDCLRLQVHNEDMSESTKEKYLGDIVDITGKIRSTVEEHRNNGYGIVAEILAIVIGRYKMKIGWKLRQAMLLMLLMNI